MPPVKVSSVDNAGEVDVLVGVRQNLVKGVDQIGAGFKGDLPLKERF